MFPDSLSARRPVLVSPVAFGQKRPWAIGIRNRAQYLSGVLQPGANWLGAATMLSCANACIAPFAVQTIHWSGTPISLPASSVAICLATCARVRSHEESSPAYDG